MNISYNYISYYISYISYHSSTINDNMQLQSTILNTLKLINKPIYIRVSKSIGQLTISSSHNLNNSSNNKSLFEDYKYLKQYSHYNFNSKYKNWFELNFNEQSNFIDSYIAKHKFKTNSNSCNQFIKQMYNENKDVNFMFFYLYEGLKDIADENNNNQISYNDHHINETPENELVFKDDVYDLLIEKEY